jgi:hypothetical protein
MITACTSVRVDVPKQPQPPRFTLMLTNIVETPNATVDQTNVIARGAVFGTSGTWVHLIALTANPYGISKAEMQVTQGSTVLYDVTNSQSIDSNGTAENALYVGGTDGSGGVGMQEIRIELPPGVLKSDVNGMRVAIIASDFYGNSKELDVSFFTDNGCGQNLTSEPGGGCLCVAPSVQCGATGCCSKNESCCGGQCLPFEQVASCHGGCAPGDIIEPGGGCCPPELPSYCAGFCYLPGVPFPANPCGD